MMTDMSAVTRAKVGKAEVDVMTRLKRCMTRANAEGAADAVWILRGRGWTWAEIGEVVGISRQGAHRRWADRAGKEPRPLRRRMASGSDWWGSGTAWKSARVLREAYEPTEPSRSLAPAQAPVIANRILGRRRGPPPPARKTAGGTDDPSPHTKSGGTASATNRPGQRCAVCGEVVAADDRTVTLSVSMTATGGQSLRSTSRMSRPTWTNRARFVATADNVRYVALRVGASRCATKGPPPGGRTRRTIDVDGAVRCVLAADVTEKTWARRGRRVKPRADP
jgi:hypothetical protein